MRYLTTVLVGTVLWQAAYAAWEMIPKPSGLSQFGSLAVGQGGNLYAFRGGSVWHSADRGATFQRSAMAVNFGGTPVDSNSLSRYSIVVAPSGSLFQSLLSRTGASERKAIVRSRDHGKTWNSVGDAEGVIGARWDSLGSPYGSAGEPVLAANRKGCLAVAYSRGLYTITPSVPALTLATDTAYLPTEAAIAFTPQLRLLIAVDGFGVRDLAPPYASYGSLNAGLGRDSTGTFLDMQYDDQENLYMVVRARASVEVNLYVLKASGAGIRPLALRKPAVPHLLPYDLNGRWLPAKMRVRDLVRR